MTTYDRDFVYIRGRAVRHTTAARDWVCGICGSRLRMAWYEEAPHWRTVCGDEESHAVDGFIHQGTWQRIAHDVMMDALRAKDIFEHLPQELQDIILAERKETTCPSKD